MSDDFTRGDSPSDLERDAERVRAQIADTAEHLKDKMSPGQLMDEVVNYFKDGDASQFLSNFKTQVRDNPMALAMVGSGLAWLMMGSGTARQSHSSMTVHKPLQPPTSLRSGGSQGSSTTSGGSQGGGIGSTLSGGVGAARDKASSMASSAGHAASSAKDHLTATAHDVRDAASDYMTSASQAGADVGSRVKNTFLDALEREPLVLGALGVAVGAAIGAMLPATRTEQEYLGSTARKVRDTAEATLAEGVDKAKHVAGDVYSAARSEADRQGLMPGDKSVGEKVAEVAKAAGDEIKSASRSAMSEENNTPGQTANPTDPKKPTSI